MKIEFVDTKYRFEHGHAPKGYGYWGFKFGGLTFWAWGTLTDAKKSCKSYVREAVLPDAGTVTVNILP